MKLELKDECFIQTDYLGDIALLYRDEVFVRFERNAHHDFKQWAVDAFCKKPPIKPVKYHQAYHDMCESGAVYEDSNGSKYKTVDLNLNVLENGIYRACLASTGRLSLMEWFKVS